MVVVREMRHYSLIPREASRICCFCGGSSHGPPPSCQRVVPAHRSRHFRSTDVWNAVTIIVVLKFCTTLPSTDAFVAYRPLCRSSGVSMPSIISKRRRYLQENVRYRLLHHIGNNVSPFHGTGGKPCHRGTNRRDYQNKCSHGLLMATSSKELKVESYERRRRRMVGSLVQGEEAKDATTIVDANATGSGTLRIEGTASTPGSGNNTSTSEESTSNHDRLGESPLVRLQRAARAELERREEKALEEAAAVDEEEKVNNIENNGRVSRNAAKRSRDSGRTEDSTSASMEEQTRQRAITSTWIRKATKGPEEKEPSPIISLDQLNSNIDKRLNLNDKVWDSRAQLPRVEGTVKPPVRDSMSSLLSYNHIRGDWRGQSAATYNVAVVFGKPLVRDQITVEYSSRIRTLARLFKDNPLFRPSLICFTGCTAPSNHVSDADAGYIFFRHMCEAQGIDLEGVDVLIDSRSRDEAEAVYRVTEGVKEDFVPRWLEAAPSPQNGFEDEKKIAVHFSLVSTEYHLCNLNDVHHRSPRQSLLKPIEALSDDGGARGGNGFARGQQYGFNYGRHGGGVGGDSDFYDDWAEDIDQYNPLSGRSRQYQSSFLRSSEEGMVETSWSYQYATYPFLYAQDEAVVFLGKCFLLAEELMPLLVNMKGVVEDEEFFQRDNYLMLASIRRSLVSKVERLNKSAGLKKALKRYQGTVNNRFLSEKGKTTRDIIVILESALLSLGRCVDLVRPAGLLVSVVSSENWKKALRALQHSLNEIRSVCDPDRPLRPTEWGKLVDEEDAMLDIGFQRMQHFVLWKDKVQRQTLSGLDPVDEDDGEADDDDDFFGDYMFSSLLSE